MRFIRLRQVLEMIGVSRTTLWRMVQAGTFPKPVAITERSRGYLLETVEAWMRERTEGGFAGPEAAMPPARIGEAFAAQPAPFRRPVRRQRA